MALRAAVNKLLLETKAEKLAAWSASATFDKIDKNRSSS
jgi:hypothetical protein